MLPNSGVLTGLFFSLRRVSPREEALYASDLEAISPSNHKPLLEVFPPSFG